MHANEALLHRFYEAFAKRDHATMAEAYAPEETFSDPVFTDLKGPEVAGMWRMLCVRGTDLELSHSDVRADDASGEASWIARYTFSATGRHVTNHVQSRFTFRDGLVVAQQDTFDFWGWTRQALGPMGLFLGWTPIVRNKVRSQAGTGLERFLAKEQAGG